jgi:hypothetical protein
VSIISFKKKKGVYVDFWKKKSNERLHNIDTIYAASLKYENANSSKFKILFK